VKSKKPRIALISIWFEPKNGVAVNRMMAFHKYLSKDFEIVVYTHGVNGQKVSESKNINYFKIPAFFDKIKHKSSDSKVLHKTKTALNIIVNKLPFSPFSNWQKKVSKQLALDHKKQPFDVILSSFSPIEPHLIAFDFKKNFPDVKWVADMRDWNE